MDYKKKLLLLSDFTSDEKQMLTDLVRIIVHNIVEEVCHE